MENNEPKSAHELKLWEWLSCNEAIFSLAPRVTMEKKRNFQFRRSTDQLPG